MALDFKANLFDQLGSLFGSTFKNPADAAKGPIGQIPGEMHNIFDPYINAGQGALGNLQGQYGNLLGDPGSVLNKIGAGYQKSPGFDFALKNALQAGSNAAAAGGMAGSPLAQQKAMQTATSLANQDYNEWLNKALGLYGTGISGEQGLYGTGFGASQSLADQIAQALAAQSALKYQGTNARNQAMGGLIGGIGSLIGGLL